MDRFDRFMDGCSYGYVSICIMITCARVREHMPVQKLRHAEGFCFGNKVYQVAFDETDAIKSKAFKPGCAFGIR